VLQLFGILCSRELSPHLTASLLGAAKHVDINPSIKTNIFMFMMKVVVEFQ